MRTAGEYRKQAEECRAQRMAVPEDKKALEEMAHAWDILAKLSARNREND